MASPDGPTNLPRSHSGRWPLALFAAALLGIGASACGSSNQSTSTASQSRTSSGTATNVAASNPAEAPPPSHPKRDSDNDNDVGAPSDDTNHAELFAYGHAADTSDRRTITALIKDYYAAVIADEGAKACAMLFSTLAEAVPEDYGHSPPGPAYLNGNTCPEVMSRLREHFHAVLTTEIPLLEVTRVRVKEEHGFAVLRFGKLPERKISVAQEGHTWKMGALLDSELS